MQLRWTATALRDLRAIHEYIASDNQSAAADVVAHLLSGIDALKQHPEMGRKGRARGTRELVVAPYVIAYRLRSSRIEILAIIHGARKWPDAF